MKRRLYFLFPSEKDAHGAVESLSEAGIQWQHVHALGKKDQEFHTLPMATKWQATNLRARIARWIWDGELALFALLVIAFVIALFLGMFSGAVLLLIAAALLVAVGAYYATRIPEMSLDEFKEALCHNEILLMVDVPYRRVNEIEQLMRKHPGAVAQGTSWTIEGIGI